jgi:hypothetical protein
MAATSSALPKVTTMNSAIRLGICRGMADHCTPSSFQPSKCQLYL